MWVRLQFFAVTTFATFLTAGVVRAQLSGLSIERVGDSVAVSWSTNDWTYALESSTNACDGAAWVKVAGDVFYSSNRLVTTVALTNSEVLVFRLQRPATVIAVDAGTVNVQNTDYPAGSTVLLRSQNGFLAPNPNTGAASVSGYVNFTQNVNFSGFPAQFIILPWESFGVSPGVFLRPRPVALP